MDSYDLKLIKSVELPEKLEMGFDYTIGARFSIVSIEKKDEFSGDFTYTHKAQLTHVEIVNKQGVTLKAVAKGSKSQVLRFRIKERGDDAYYEMVMSKIIENLDEVLTLLKV